MALLQLESASKAYWRARVPVPALAEVSLEVETGEFIALYGESRSGKTTLLRLAAGLEQPDSGSVSFAGRDLGTMSRRELALHRLTNVGCVWASWQSVTGFRVCDHVALPLLAAGWSRKRARERGAELLVRLEIEELADARLDELSDGERVRVALAHALIREPLLLLADEPVATLALIERDAILTLLQRVAAERSIAVVATATEAAHVLRAERVVGISGGRLLDEGETQVEFAQVVELARTRGRRG